MLTVPPTGPTRNRASSPAPIAPSDAPAPTSPNSRRRLPRVEQRVREAPRLHRRDHPEAVDPHVEHAGEEPREGADLRFGLPIGPERIPEQHDVGAEEHQRRHGHGAGPEPRGDARVNRHEQRQRERHGGVHVHEVVRAVPAAGRGCYGSASRAGTPRRRRRCTERKGGRGALRRIARRRTAGAAEPWDGRSLLQVTHVLGLRMLQRILAPLVELRKGEAATAFMMFAYSFLAMTAWNTIRPITRSKFITSLGADNLPYVLLAAGFIIGILMAGYAWLIARLPRRWGLPIVQVGLAALLVLFWFLFQTPATWVSVAFYVAGLILGLLLISQFWTVANVVYDPRQAKRLFGFIGTGAPLGGIAGSALASYAPQIGSTNLLLPSAGFMLLCAALVAAIIRRERVEADPIASVKGEKGVSAAEAFNLLRRLEAPADHRARDQLRGARGLHHRAAAEHGGAGRERRRGDRFHHGVSRAGRPVDLDDRVRRPDLADEQDPSIPGHRLRADGAPRQPRIHGDRHAAERRALGAGSRARAGPVAAIHRRQDHPRDPVPAAAERRQAQSEIVPRRHRRSRGEGDGGAAAAGARPAVGTAAGLAASQLRHPGGDGRVGLHVDPRAQGLPQGVPPEHRAPRRRARRGPAERRRSVDHRNAGAGAGAAGPGPGRLRHRHARVARQAQPRHAAAPLSRLTRRCGSARCAPSARCAATSACGGSRRSGAC